MGGSYPVAYRAGAAVAPGFQEGVVLPEIPRAPGPLIGFMAGFIAMWKALDLLEQYPKPVDFGGSLDELYDAERVEGKLDAAERALAKDEMSALLAPTVEYTVSPAFNGFRNTGTCALNLGACPVNWCIGPEFDDFYTATLCTQTSQWPNIIAHRPLRNPMSNNWVEWHSRGGTTAACNNKWSRNAGYTGTFSPYPRVLPVNGQIAGEGVENELEDLDRRTFPTAWSLPIKNVGQIMNPPRAWPWVRPVAVPRPAEVPGVGPLPVPVSVPKVTPEKLVNSLTRALSPPKPREKELKMRTLKATMLFKSAYGFVTELEDFACAMAKALPKSAKSRSRNFVGVGQKSGRRNALKRHPRRGYRCAQQVYEAWGNLNSDIIKQMAIEVIMNEIEDWTYGQFGKFNREVSRRFFGQAGAPFGFQTAMQGGGGGKLKMAPKIETEKIRPVVTYMVNTMWAEGFEGIPFRSVKEARRYVR